jgi:hypothetical protein
MSKQITVRNVSAELARRLHRLSQARNESLNTTVIRLLEQAVDIDERRERLSRYATWTAEDLEEFEQSLRAQRIVDADLWK